MTTAIPCCGNCRHWRKPDYGEMASLFSLPSGDRICDRPSVLRNHITFVLRPPHNFAGGYCKNWEKVP